ncbi:MAG: hypothetical protein ACI8UD_003781 [Planctomycetota bacterium]
MLRKKIGNSREPILGGQPSKSGPLKIVSVFGLDASSVIRLGNPMKTALVICALASTAMAQFSVGPQTATYNAAASRGFNFVANVAFTIDQLDVPTDNQLAGDLASYYVEVNGAQVFLSVNQPGAVLTPGIPQIQIGDAVTIVGHWNSLTQAHNSYAAGAPLTANLQGVPHTFYRAAAGFIAAPGFVGGGFGGGFSGSMGRCDVYTSPVVGAALNTSYGASCGGNGSNPAFYELFADATVANATLNDGTLILTAGASGYQGAWAPATAAALFVAPTAAAIPMATGDDGQVTYTPAFGPMPTPYGPQASLQVHGNAIIGFGGAAITYPGTNSYTPTGPGFAGNLGGGLYAWHDYNINETGSGQILAEEVGSTLYITWDGVESYSSPTVLNPSTLQFQINLTTGDVRIVFFSIDANATSTFGSAHLVGAVAPGGSADPGSIDLLTATAQELTMITATLDLELVGTTRPIIGTNWDLTTNNIEAVSPFGITFFGDRAAVALPLTAIGLAAPGCDINLSTLLGNITGIAAAGSATISLALPNNPALVGALLSAQTLALSLTNGANITTSNGIEGTLGDS